MYLPGSYARSFDFPSPGDSVRLIGISLLSAGLLACPSPPEQQGAGGPAPAGPQGQQQDAAGGDVQAAVDAVPTTDAGGGPGPADGMAEPLDLGDKMKQTQDQIKNGEHFTVSGEVKGDCSGALRVSVIGTDAAPDQEGDPDKVTNANRTVAGQKEALQKQATQLAKKDEVLDAAKE